VCDAAILKTVWIDESCSAWLRNWSLHFFIENI
jgi:hypothetical protein